MRGCVENAENAGLVKGFRFFCPLSPPPCLRTKFTHYYLYYQIIFTIIHLIIYYDFQVVILHTITHYFSIIVRPSPQDTLIINQLAFLRTKLRTIPAGLVCFCVHVLQMLPVNNQPWEENIKGLEKRCIFYISYTGGQDLPGVPYPNNMCRILAQTNLDFLDIRSHTCLSAFADMPAQRFRGYRVAQSLPGIFCKSDALKLLLRKPFLGIKNDNFGLAGHQKADFAKFR